jgi:hypothetical protein
MPENSPKSDDAREAFIVITGDPVAGFIFTGPFVNHEAAEQWAEGLQDWWTAFLQRPAQRFMRAEKHEMTRARLSPRATR